jgi:eukaryotic-like serine/threonine-protein kinase
MGEVYRARDTTLKRHVALKVLPLELSSNADRIARFQREAEVQVSLNHPNIAHLYGLAEADGVRALVMELAEGKSPKGPMPF